MSALVSETDLSAIAAAAPGVLYTFQMRPDGRVCFPYASPQLSAIFGVEPQALAWNAAAAFERVHSDDVGRVRTSIADSARRLSEWHEEFRILHPRSGEVWAEGRSIPERQADGSVLWRGFLLDVTERKRTDQIMRSMEADLRESEARYRTLAEAAHDAIFILGPDCRFEYVNHAAAVSLNRCPDEIVGRRVEELFAPQAAASIAREVKEVRRTRKALYSEQPMPLGDRETWQGAWLAPIVDDGPSVTRVMGIARDITARKQLALLLERQHGVVNAIIQASSAGIGLLHGDSFVCDLANPALQQLAPDRAIRGAAFTAWWPGAAIPLLDMFERVRTTGTAEEADNVRIPALAPGGEPCTVAISASRVQTHSEAPGVLILVADVSARKALERQFHQAQKMEAVGRLAGGIAHDFNNLLTSILGYAELVLETLTPEDERRSDLEQIRKAGASASALTRQLLTFSRRDIAAPTVLDVNISLERFQSILTRTLGEDVDVVFQLEPAVDGVLMDVGQLEQVVMNLCVNARDAMPRGGTLTIHTGNVRLDREEQVQHRWAPPGDYVFLKVSDTGSGMTSEVQAHLFEPFFTTKPFGKGTGLGLSTVYGIVVQSHGFIAVASEPEQGTTFTIYLPKAEGRARVQGEPSASEAPMPGRGTVLIAEDNEALRMLAKRTLDGCGYQTIAAKDATEALQLTDAFQGRIDLLLTDVVMPGLDGLELSHALARRHPETRVLFMSGYTHETISHHGLLDRGVQFLQKPFSCATIARKVHEVLTAVC